MYLNTIIIDNKDIQISEKGGTKIAVNLFNNLFDSMNGGDRRENSNKLFHNGRSSSILDKYEEHIA